MLLDAVIEANVKLFVVPTDLMNVLLCFVTESVHLVELRGVKTAARSDATPVSLDVACYKDKLHI